MENRRALMKSTDMQGPLQKIVVDTCVVAMEQYDEERDIAAYVKKHMDKYDGGVWHCVLGKDFG
ncbi:dynein light chain LC8-type [Schistosoma bovis]|uniref:Dynein light chain n=1 Tax=Schistosoma bovis TaxID=6184 RepID=A0A430QFD5_SCHBO|nr:dynein light chain LC8-type [Schistosoma bovis]